MGLSPDQQLLLTQIRAAKNTGFYDASSLVPPDLRHNPFYRWAWLKVHHYGEDCIIGVSGKTGRGKTTLSCRFAELFDRDRFGKTRFPAYSFEEFRNEEGFLEKRLVLAPRLVNSIGDYKRLKTNTSYPVGTAFVIDEAQAILNSRDFMSRKNKDVIRLLSTGRVFRSYTFINLPYWENLDSQIKNYLHAVVIVHRPDKSTGTSFYSPYLLEPIGYGKPPMAIRFRKLDEWGRRYFVEECEETLPNPSLRKAQDMKVTLWKQGVARGIINEGGDTIIKNNTKKKETKKDREEKAKQIAHEKRNEREMFQYGKTYSVTRIMHVLEVERPIAEKIAYHFKSWDQLEEKV